jgi:glycosyltransferase involved in cell wall biosynthesis
MTRIILHSNSISERGDSSNAESLSLALNRYLNVETLIVYNKLSEMNNSNRIKEMISRGHELISYSKPEQLHDIGRSWGATHSYFACGGEYSPLWVRDTIRLTHAIFNNYEPHGDRYNYVSEWLFAKATRVKHRRTPEVKICELKLSTGSPYSLDTNIPIDWVPHIVSPIDGDGNFFRKRFLIPNDAILIGRIGGFTEFNDTAAQMGVIELVEKFKNFYFLFINTKKFYQHPRIKHIDYLSSTEKWDFYAAGDLFINGRLMGESFGFSICEALSIGKPIIAPNFHRNLRMDRHHISILRHQALLYKSKAEFKRQVLQQVNDPIPKINLIRLVNKFSPKSSIRLFASKFLGMQMDSC